MKSTPWLFSLCQAYGMLSFAGGVLAVSERAADSVKPSATASSYLSASLQACSLAMDGRLPSPVPNSFKFGGQVRRYYVSAEEVSWDYAPTGWDNWLGVPMNNSARAKAAGATTYGTRWLKALYRGYTDASFTTKSSAPSWQGSQGPTLRAEVGDLIEILFVNKLSKNYATMHSMGLAYAKSSEGSDYPSSSNLGQAGNLSIQDAVPPGQCVVYKWIVTKSDGPSGRSPAKVHSYHSYVSLEEDANTGLIGPTIIYAPGQMTKTMSTHREFPLLFNTYAEAQSWLSGKNNAQLTGNSSAAVSVGSISTMGLPQGNASVWLPQLTNYEDATRFSQAPTYYAMNGYVFANNPPFEMCLDDKVIWYVNSYGSSSHVFHMHGNGYSYLNNNEYAGSVNDGVGKTLYMEATGEGQWQVICHVQNHLSKGMVANYKVYAAGSCPLQSLSR